MPSTKTYVEVQCAHRWSRGLENKARVVAHVEKEEIEIYVEYGNTAATQGYVEVHHGSVDYLHSRKMVYSGLNPLVLQCCTVTMHMRLLHW
jgi:hypothetical protein